MTILDYSGILNRGVSGAGQTAIQTQQQLQGLRAGQQQTQRQQQQDEAAQAAAIQDVANRQEGARLLTEGTPNEIAEFGIKNPSVMKDFVSMAKFKDESAQGARVRYAQDVLSGAVNPREALTSRIDEVERAGGDATGLRETLALDDAGIKAAAEKDLAVMAPRIWKTYNEHKESLTPKAVQGTATQKDFAEYQRLKTIDPEGAKQFGTAAGFISDGKKRLFQVKRNDDGTTTKYFSDGTEEIVTATEKVKTKDMRGAMSQEQAVRIVDKAKEGQLKNAGFALTLNDGLNTVNSMVDKGYDPMSATWINKYLAGTTLGNIAMSDDDQLFSGSVEQMINAIARRETGAAITEFEKKDFFNRYMPVAGDSSKRITQKRNALERQFKSIRGQSGSVYDAIRLTQGLEQQAEQAALTDDELLRKYGG